MKLVVIFLAIVAFFYVSVSVWNVIQRRKGIVAATNKRSCHSADEGCCGRHAVCEKQSSLKTVGDKVEYFDDEELDVYAGTPSGRYPEEAVEQFREVLYSMYDKDKPGWIRSLQQRGIAFPEQLKGEMLQIMGNLHSAKQ